MNKVLSVWKGYNLRHHLETEHSDFNQRYSGEFRKQKVASLVSALEVE
jgi:hypothetical protein